MIPSIGRIVHYKISAEQAKAINKSREHARIGADIAGGESPVRHGNPANEGDVYPMLITRLWTDEPIETSPVQGQVFLDGNDTLWVTSAQQGDGVNRWADPRS